MIRLSVNIDHVATIRQARRAAEPDPVQAAVLAELGGADGIAVHLRGDRRHVQDRDVEVLRRIVRTRFNLRMSATQEMVRVALTLNPDEVTLVPERAEEVSTEGGSTPSSTASSSARRSRPCRRPGSGSASSWIPSWSR